MNTNEEIEILKKIIRAGIKGAKMFDIDANVDFFIKERIDSSNCENIALNVHTNNYIAHLYIEYNGEILIEDFAYKGRNDKSKDDPIVFACYRMLSSIIALGMLSMNEQKRKNTTR